MLLAPQANYQLRELLSHDKHYFAQLPQKPRKHHSTTLNKSGDWKQVASNIISFKFRIYLCYKSTTIQTHIPLSKMN